MNEFRKATGLSGGSTQLNAVTLTRKGDRFCVSNFGRIRTLDPTEDPHFDLTFREFCKDKGVRPRNLVAGLSGNSIMVRYIKVPVVPDWKLDMMMEFEIEEQTNVFSKDSYCDYRKVDIPGIRKHNVMMIGIGTREYIDYYLDNIPGIEKFNLNSLGLYSSSFLLNEPVQDEEIAVLLDIGAMNTEIVIVKGQSLLFARNIQYGGSYYDKDIVTALNVDISQAESMKIGKGSVLNSSNRDAELEGTEKALNECLTASSRMLYTHITSAIQYCKEQMRYYDISLSRILMTGGGSQLKGLDGFLEDHFKVSVTHLDVSDSLDLGSLSVAQAEEFRKDIHFYTTTLGLAVSVMHEKGAVVNPMPARVLKRRRFFKREFFLIAASILFLISLILWGWFMVSENSFIDNGIERRKTLLSQAQELERKIRSEEALYERFRVMENSLKSRVYSSTDMLEIINILQGSLPDDIWITSFSTEDIGAVAESDKTPDRKKEKVNERKKTEEETIQTRGTIYISGQVRVDSDSSSEPHQLLDDYTRRLKKEYSRFSEFIPMKKEYDDPLKKEKFFYKYRIIISNTDRNDTAQRQ